jgi:hypothetical protein
VKEPCITAAPLLSPLPLASLATSPLQGEVSGGVRAQQLTLSKAPATRRVAKVVAGHSVVAVAVRAADPNLAPAKGRRHPAPTRRIDAGVRGEERSKATAMEKRKPAMWKEATVPSTTPSCAVPSCAVPSRTMHRCAVPSATAAPSTSRLRRSSDQCSADCDRRCETSQFPLIHGVLPRQRRPTQRGTGKLNYSMNDESNFAIDETDDVRKIQRPRTGRRDERQFMCAPLPRRRGGTRMSLRSRYS